MKNLKNFLLYVKRELIYIQGELENFGIWYNQPGFLLMLLFGSLFLFIVICSCSDC